jgi:hypothetical protein
MRLTTLTTGVLALTIAAGLAVADTRPWEPCQLIEKKQDKDVKTRTVKGTLQTIASDKLTVASEGKKTVDLQINSGTKITVEGKEGALTDLRKGQQVTCTYVVREGANVCSSIAARSGKR